MSKYRFGTYFKGKMGSSDSIVINENTDPKDIENFLKDCPQGIKKKIEQGNSELSYKIKAENERRKQALKTAQQEEQERVAKMVEEKVAEATKKPVEAKKPATKGK